MNDYKGQLNNTASKHVQNQPDYGIVDNSGELLIKDKHFLYMSRKAERVVAAVYLLSSYMPENEPLRCAIRDCSIKIIPEQSMFNLAPSKISNANNTYISGKIILLNSMLKTAYMTGYISEMNYQILSKELNNLMSIYDEYSHNNSSTDVSGLSNYLDNENAQFKKGHESIKDKKVSLETGVLKDSTSSNISEIDSLPARGKRYFEKTASGLTSGIDNAHKRESIKGDRQISIIDIIRNKKAVSLKDIVGVIKDCSDKTIQRELRSMVKTGVLKVEGRKRWSKYSLNL